MPPHLNDPFDYEPDALCRAAAERVKRYIARHKEWHDELAAGKMLGVLAVRDNGGCTGFLAAFSGNLAGTNDHPYFVPAVYDMLSPDGFFRRGEAEISEINRRIAELSAAPQRLEALAKREQAEESARTRLAAMREQMQRSKALRDARRSRTDDPARLVQLDNESRHEKSEYRRLKEELLRQAESARAEASRFESEIGELKNRRRERSEVLQRQLFDHFELADSRGCRRTILDIFAEAAEQIPPAGTGECAAPKLLHYAFTHNLTPLSIAEFWYGASPKGEIRRHGSYYPACRGKCKPLLDYMLRGMELRRTERQPLPEPTIVYEDSAVAVIDKPAGMLSVEGKIDAPSVAEWARRRFIGAADPRPVHRLDMATSGLLLIAKDAESYRLLQEQFRRRTVRKRYIALLEGEVTADEGRIELPMRPDPHDRPRQVIDRDHGKAALTLYKVLERQEGCTLVAFEPVTGRTHQLRVHASAAEGLNAPIAGDTLYGARPAERLSLHNEYIEFTHPQTGERLSFLSPAVQSFTKISSMGLR